MEEPSECVYWAIAFEDDGILRVRKASPLVFLIIVNSEIPREGVPATFQQWPAPSAFYTCAPHPVPLPSLQFLLQLPNWQTRPRLLCCGCVAVWLRCGVVVRTCGRQRYGIKDSHLDGSVEGLECPHPYYLFNQSELHGLACCLHILQKIEKMEGQPLHPSRGEDGGGEG